MVILIYTRSIELEFPILPHLGVLRLLGFCQPLKQYLKPVLICIFISLVPQCFHMFIGCLGFLFCDLPICCLCPLLCQVVFCCYLVLILCQLLAFAYILSCSVACLFTLCFLCLLCFKKSLPPSKNHKNGLLFFFQQFFKFYFFNSQL